MISYCYGTFKCGKGSYCKTNLNDKGAVRGATLSFYHLNNFLINTPPNDVERGESPLRQNIAITKKENNEKAHQVFHC